ncbi:hypothetical protein QBC34DRAFT_403104 [Podospora aff. communis PSN243]|uniref:RanBP2-type domain-containing protein n=1 Tax=Podospora aff. communis PSN243 TaxID=3040156 RepID=A0AAV9GNN6_9PEZI|nr:hypothetical protein QBC34DRAFT_403104 [Podospora aff. communis PSN243]
MSQTQDYQEPVHYRSRSPEHRAARRNTDHDHRRRRHDAGAGEMGEYVTRRLIPAVMDRSERPVKVVVNFGDMKIDDPDDASGGMSPSIAPNAIIFNAPGSTLEMSGSASTTSTVDSRALRQRITRGRGLLPYSTLPAPGVRGRVPIDSSYRLSYATDYDRGGVDVPLPPRERLLGFDRGGARLGWSMGACAICQIRSLVNRRGHCEECEPGRVSLPVRKHRYEADRDVEYPTRTSWWMDDSSEVSYTPRNYTPRNRSARYSGLWSGKLAGYDSDWY